MIAGFDGPELGVVSAIAVALIGAIGLVWKARIESKAGSQKDTIAGCISLINELQQERDTDKKNHAIERQEMLRSMARCDRRVTSLQSRMSMLVNHVRSVESYLRKNHLIEKAPKMNWDAFYLKNEQA